MSQRILDLIERRKRWIAINQENGFEEGIKNLLTDLYPDSAHFVFELLQNAEDAKATVAIFRLLNNSLEFEHNGSRLFSIDDVESITSIGRSYKKDDPTNIGKFGVGFKSVYSYTLTPEVLSGDYHFQIHDLVVPNIDGLESKPIGQDVTRIIIPFNNPDKPTNNAVAEITNLLNSLNESTLLFLSNIERIEYSLPNGQTGFVEREDSDENLVHIKTAVPGDNETSTISYYLFSKDVEVDDEKRDTKTCRISIAFKVEQTQAKEKNDYDIRWKIKQIEPGRVSIYFPAYKETSNLKFHINAPFASTVARDSVRDCGENKVLRDQIATLVVESLFFLRDNNLLTVDVLSVLPNRKDGLSSFYEPILDKVVEAFKNEDLTPMKMGGHAAASGVFRGTAQLSSLITDEDLVVLLNYDYNIPMWVANAPQRNSRSDDFLSMLEITEYKISDFVAALSDMPSHIYEWITAIGFERLIRIYRFLASREKEPEDLDLKKSKIVPIKEKKITIFSCVQNQPIYFECTHEDEITLAKRPSCVDKSIDFVDPDFYSLIKDDTELKDWMTKHLEVYPFSIGNYAVDVLNWLVERKSTISDKELVAVSAFIVENKNKDSDLRELPVLLIDGVRMNLGEILDQQAKQLVVPINHDPETGWQNLFKTESDRKHLYILSDTYLDLSKDRFNLLINFMRATENPLLDDEHFPSIYIDNSHYSYYFKPGLLLSDYEIDELEVAAKNSTGNRRHLIEYSRKKPISFEAEQITEQFCNSLIRWLTGIGKQAQSRRTSVDKLFQSKISYQYYGENTRVIDSMTLKFLKETKWLYTTMGYCVPQEAFIKDQKVEEILADSVPYVLSDLPDNVLSMLGVNSDVGTDFLIERLLIQSKMNSGSARFAEKVYITLRSRFDTGNSWTTNQQISVLREGKCILVGITEDNSIKWAYPADCIWMDRSDIFGDKFIYLSTLYPKLKDFFVSHLMVNEDVKDEHFGKLWLNIQEMPEEDHDKIVKSMSMIYERISVIIKSDLKNLDWLKQLQQKAKIYTERGVFENPSKVFIPNDGKLKRLFDRYVEFTWLPEKTSYNQWSQLFGFFGVAQLKHSVIVTLDNSKVDEEAKQNRFLTISCKLLIAIWLKEKKEDLYKNLIDNGGIEQLINTKEYASAEIKLTYLLENQRVSEASECFWDSQASRLLLTQKSNKRIIADSISRELCNNSSSEELKNWIESKLGYSGTDFQAVMAEENWQIPEELKAMIGKQEATFTNSDHEESPAEKAERSHCEDVNEEVGNSQEDNKDSGSYTPNDRSEYASNSFSSDNEKQSSKSQESNSRESSGHRAGESSESKTNSSERSDFEEDSEEETEPKQSFAEELFSGFNTKDQPIQDDECYVEGGYSGDSLGRYVKEYDRVREYRDNNQSQTERYREVRRIILDGPDPLVRAELTRWYSGKCQICGSSFYQRNGKPFFISHYMVPRRSSVAADAKGNAICLCANHFAQMLHGRRKSSNLLIQLGSIDPANESFELKLELNGEDVSIKYNQQHAIALKAFYEATNKESE